MNTTEELFYAVQDPATTLSKVQSLINSGADVNAYDTEHGETVLMWASAKTQDPEVIHALVKAGAEVNHITEEGISALALACLKPDYKITKALIDCGADVNICNAGHWTVLMSLVSRPNPNIDIIKLLVQAGANVNKQNRAGATPLLLAAGKTENPEVINILIKAGANANYWLRDDDSEISPLKSAAFDNPNPEIVKALVKGGADVNKKDEKGFTALHYAASENNYKVVEALIEAGANIMARAKDGSGIFITAAMHNNSDVINTLIKAGLYVDATDYEGNTPLMRAVIYNPDIDVIRTLIKNEANVNAMNKMGLTALMASAAADKPEFAKILLQAGANLYIQSKDGRTVADFIQSREFALVLQSYLKR